jgi:hypothetical protein
VQIQTSYYHSSAIVDEDQLKYTQGVAPSAAIGSVAPRHDFSFYSGEAAVEPMVLCSTFAQNIK